MERADDSQVKIILSIYIILLGPQLPTEALAYLQERQTMKRTFNRLRQREYPENPKRLEDLAEIPPEFRMTAKGKSFLLWDSYDDDDDSDDGQEENVPQKRILLFAARSDLKKLAASGTLQLDGTFDPAPDIFAQILTVHGEVNNETLPLAYALLPDKSGVSWLFQTLP
ncbi:uncharacterized protein LOC127749903 [Frankliniella occidentalis]|uniref:Uncharacterized protein LOC127749903 n=1 Tax=Frankliniella occidentalis TaxID=133901 RepID=A0A9C6UBS9_FRAOC|nr:uncharacterized protein LOC127749903 [Frankliniella occidentalis]